MRSLQGARSAQTASRATWALLLFVGAGLFMGWPIASEAVPPHDPCREADEHWLPPAGCLSETRDADCPIEGAAIGACAYDQARIESMCPALRAQLSQIIHERIETRLNAIRANAAQMCDFSKEQAESACAFLQENAKRAQMLALDIETACEDGRRRAAQCMTDIYEPERERVLADFRPCPGAYIEPDDLTARGLMCEPFALETIQTASMQRSCGFFACSPLPGACGQVWSDRPQSPETCCVFDMKTLVEIEPPPIPRVDEEAEKAAAAQAAEEAARKTAEEQKTRCIQVTEDTAKYEGRMVYPRCQDSLTQVRPICQAPASPPVMMAVDCRTVEYAPGQTYAGCQRGYCDKTRTRSFEELQQALQATHLWFHKVRDFSVDLTLEEWSILKERQGELDPAAWRTLMVENERLFKMRNTMINLGVVSGPDRLRAYYDQMKSTLGFGGRWLDQLYEQAAERSAAYRTADENSRRFMREYELASRRAQEWEELSKILEEQRQWRSRYEQMSEFEKWMDSARGITPGLRLLRPENRRVFMDSKKPFYKRIDAAMGPAGGMVPVIGWPLEGVKAASMAKAKLMNGSKEVTWIDVGTSTLSAALPGLPHAKAIPLSEFSKQVVADVGGDGLSAVDIAKDEAKRGREREQLKQEHLRREEWQRTHPESQTE